MEREAVICRRYTAGELSSWSLVLLVFYIPLSLPGKPQEQLLGMLEEGYNVKTTLETLSLAGKTDECLRSLKGLWVTVRN